MILLPKSPKLIDSKDNWARFEIEGLYPGYGVTVGNSLRRVLISSLEGAAITEVKIKGVTHEFSTIPGVLEDVMTIGMNLKQMRFKVHSEEPVKATLKIKGDNKKVKGSDFKIPTQMELVNGDVHIVTLTSAKTDFEMEIKVEQGIGYEPVERRTKDEKLEIGIIPIDAIYTPIKRVSYKVENMRVGDRTDFDKLTIDITTDGIVTPEEAFYQSSDILVKHFSLISAEFEPKKEVPKKEVVSKVAPKKTAKKEEKKEEKKESNPPKADQSKTGKEAKK